MNGHRIGLIGRENRYRQYPISDWEHHFHEGKFDAPGGLQTGWNMVKMNNSFGTTGRYQFPSSWYTYVMISYEEELFLKWSWN